MKTGAVLEINKGKAVLLKTDGSFVTVKAKKGWERGEIVMFQEKSYTRIISAAACLLALLLFLPAAYLYVTPETYISVDVNPSVELSVNHFGRIISAKAYNKGAEKILDEMKLKNKNYEAAVKELVSNKKLEQYIEKNAYVLFTVFSNNEIKEQQVLQYLTSTAAEEVRVHHEGTQVDCHEVDKETLEQAHHNGTTAGKYSAIEELQKENPDINVKEYTHHSVGEIKDEIERCHNGEHLQGQKGEGGESSSTGHHGKQSHKGHHEE